MSVHELLDELREIGRDPQTGGYRRFSWTPVDLELREWFKRQGELRGLPVESDRNGNLWATLEAAASNERVAVGSHLDSVPDGGAFDGPLGIASALAAIDQLRSGGLRPQRSLALVVFSEEEGARFGVACLGSRLLTGAIEPERARALRDADGVTLETAMKRAGGDPVLLGPDPMRLADLTAYVELHIEQGRALAELGQPVAIGSEIWPHGRWRLDFEGRADHAGTTRMEDRNDPMARFTATASRVYDEARRLAARATFGRLDVVPNATNAIPSRVIAWLDARAESDTDLEGVVRMADSADSVIAESVTSRVVFDEHLRKKISTLLDDPPVLATAAGHDAGILASSGVRAAMLFVRNPTGISHSPDEQATPEDCQAGTTALAAVLKELADFK